MEGTKSIDRAVSFIMEAHEGQFRRFSGAPYHVHPLEVATILGVMGLATETTYIKALNHDVVEDTEKTLEDIREMFGDEVAKSVDMLTKPEHYPDWKEMSRMDKIHAYGTRMLDGTQEDHNIKLADILANVPDMAANAKIKKGFSYIAEKEVMLTYLTKGSQVLYSKVSKMLEEEKAKLEIKQSGLLGESYEKGRGSKEA